MSTIIHFLGIAYGAIPLVGLAVISIGVWFYTRGRKQKNAAAVARVQEAAAIKWGKEALLAELAKQESAGLAAFKERKFSVAEYHFSAAAQKAGELGERRKQLFNQHRACVAMSRCGCERCLLACRKLKELIAEMTSELAAGDKLLATVRTNLETLEKSGLRKAVEEDFAGATRHFEKGEMHEANRLYGQSYRVAKEIGELVLCARILQEYSSLMAQEGKVDRAVKSLEIALEFARKNCDEGDGLPLQIEWSLGYYRILHDEAAVRELLSQTKAAYNKRDVETAADLAEQAVAMALQNLRVDHWLTADALNHRACIKMSGGFYSEARADLDDALVILSEWPEQAEKMLEHIQSNMEKCRRDMGY